MKRIFLMTLAAAMLLGLTQCKKPTPWGDDNTSGGLKTVTFTVNDDSKGIFVEEQDGTSARRLRYKWADGDKLYVYGSVNGNFESDGELIGTLTTHNADSYSALFRGELDLKKYNTTHSKLRFYHFGNGVTITDGAATSNLTSQNGTIGAVSSKVIACSDDITVKNESEYTSSLTIKFAVAKLDLTKFAAGESSSIDVKMKTSSGTQVKVSAQGVLTYSGEDGTCTLGGVSTSSNAYDVILLPGAKVHLDFSTEANNKTCSGDMNVEANKFYYNKNNPSIGVVINAEGPQHLEGGFSIANGTKVQFSRGNLYYKGNINTYNGEWGFTDNQWDFYTAPNMGGNGYCEGNVYHKTGSPYWGSFCWSLGKNNNYGVCTANADAYDNETYVDYGGNVTGIGSEWFTLSGAQWIYLLNERADAKSRRGFITFRDGSGISGTDEGCRVSGLVILPDETEDPKTVLGKISKIDDLATYNAVFLPSSGSRSDKVYAIGGDWWYNNPTAWFWTSTGGSDCPRNIVFTHDVTDASRYWTDGDCSGALGRGVRLVRYVNN